MRNRKRSLYWKQITYIKPQLEHAQQCLMNSPLPEVFVRYIHQELDTIEQRLNDVLIKKPGLRCDPFIKDLYKRLFCLRTQMQDYQTVARVLDFLSTANDPVITKLTWEILCVPGSEHSKYVFFIVNTHPASAEHSDDYSIVEVINRSLLKPLNASLTPITIDDRFMNSLEQSNLLKPISVLQSTRTATLSFELQFHDKSYAK